MALQVDPLRAKAPTVTVSSAPYRTGACLGLYTSTNPRGDLLSKPLPRLGHGALDTDNGATKESKSALELSPSPTNSQISQVLAAFLPSAKPPTRSLAQLVISRLVSDARPSPTTVPTSPYEPDQEKATQNLIRLFTPIFESRLSNIARRRVPALGLFTALLQTVSAMANRIFWGDGAVDAVLDVPDLFEGKKGIIPSAALSAPRPVRAAAVNTLTTLPRGTAENVTSDAFSALGGPATNNAVEEARRKEAE
ncbi:hypothetical protein FRC05_010367 [Tulasnella sp. 425]|nr:hypothetical protein FRC05_010367 [Tulasnella sp. 425]